MLTLVVTSSSTRSGRHLILLHYQLLRCPGPEPPRPFVLHPTAFGAALQLCYPRA